MRKSSDFFLNLALGRRYTEPIKKYLRKLFDIFYILDLERACEIMLSPDNLRLLHVVVGVGDGHNVAPVHIVAHGRALSLVDGC